MEPQNNRYSRSRRVWLGLFIVLAGVLLLLHRIGFPVPYWLFSWPVVMIGIGFIIGIRRDFTDFSSLFLMLLGCYFLARNQGWITFSIGAYFWPVLFIIIGLLIILRPRYKWNGRNYTGHNIDSGSVFDSIAIFWASRRTVLSKTFSRGDVINIFGGTEINFSQADISNTAVLDVVCLFGGIKLIVPTDWDVRINVVHVFAGTDDKRSAHTSSENKKVLLITGTAIFGGIDIRNY